MGSPGRTAGRRTRSTGGGNHLGGAAGFPTFAHGQYTVEGEIERAGAFGRGLGHLHGPARWGARAIVAAIAATFAIGLVAGIVQLIGQL